MNSHAQEFCQRTADLITTEEVQSMSQWKHHGDISTLDHSIFVAYTSYRIALRFGWDAQATARGGLLHDLYLHNAREKTRRKQCFEHPRVAAENADAITKLTERERNIILSHMWPCGGPMPRYKEAWLVAMVDTFCATLELMGFCNPARLRAKLSTAQ